MSFSAWSNNKKKKTNEETSFSEWSNNGGTSAKSKIKETKASALPAGSTFSPVNTGGTTKASSFEEWSNNKKYNSWNSLETWGQVGIDLINEGSEFYSTWHGDENDETYRGFQDRASNILAYADNWRKQYAGNDEAISYIDSIVSALSDSKSHFMNYRDYYSQFDDEESYNAYVAEYTKENERQQTYGGKSADELWGIIGNMDAGSEKEWVTNYAYSVMTVDDYDKIIAQKEAEHEALVAEWDKAAYENGYSANDKEYREYVDKINASETEIDNLKRRRYFAEKETRYGGLKNNEDYSEYSTQVSDDPTSKLRIGNWDIIGDLTYDYINDIDGTREKQDYSGEGNARGNVDLYKYSFMTDTEIAQYNYIYNTEGKKAANEYLDYLTYDLDARRTQQLSERNAEFATEHPVLSSIYSVPTNLLSGIGLVDNIGQNVVQGARELITGEYKPVNYNTNAMNPTIATMAIRGTVAQNLANEYGVIDIDAEEHPFWSKALNGKSLGDVYQLGMSMVDSGTVALLSPVIGTFGTALLGGAAGSQGVLDAVSRGATDKQAMWMGIFNGTFEMLFEKVSLDNLLKGNARNVVMAFLQQGFIEGSEELSTSFANNIADILIMAEKSGYRRSIAAYMDAGLTEEEATKAALKDAAMDMAWDFIGGVISGGIMGGGKQALGNTVNNVLSIIPEARNAKNIYNTELPALIDEALDLDPDNELAKKIKSKIDSGKRVSGFQIRNLVNQNEAAIYAQDVTTIESAAADRLVELGEKGNIENIAKAIAKQAAGQELTDFEIERISNSKYGQRVANELNPDNINSGDYSSEWTGTLDTNRINPTEYSRLIEASEIVQENTTPTENKVVTNVAKPSQEVADDVAEDVASPVKAAAPVEVVEETSVTPETEKKSTLTIEDASKKYGAQAGAMLHTYVSGQDVAKYDAAYKIAYDMGKSGVALSYAMNSEAVAYLSENQRELAYEAGKAAADTAAQTQEAKNKQAATGKTGRKKGVVKAEGVSLAEIRSTFNDTQKTAYKLLSSYAETTGVDIVLYKSEANEQGDFEGAQGKFKWSEDTIYIDINAGLANIKSMNDLAKYAMLRTFAHEFTHFIEKWNPVKYNEFRKVVFDTLTERGEDVSKLIDEKLSQDSTGKMTYDMASREVVAEAMTDILPDANFVQELAENHKNIFQKLLEKLKEFVAELKAYYNTIGHNRSREANALKEQVGDAVQYVENIVKMFDKIAAEAVENYQQTVAVEATTVAETTTVEETAPVVEETTTTETKEPVSITDELGFTITDNVEHGSLEISFEGKPSEQVRDVLKDNKFRWHRNKKVWYGYADRAAITDALRAAYEAEAVEQPAEEQPKSYEPTQEERSELADAIGNTMRSAMPTSVTDTVQSEAVTPAQEETTVEEAKKELRKAVRMPIQGTNAEALLQGIKSKELSMESITLSGQVDGFTAEQREHLVTKLIEGVYTDNKTINIDVPYDGKFEVENTPASVAKVLNELKVKVTQEIIFDKQTVNMLQSSGKVVITEFNGQKYISNGGAILLPISDVGVEYARKELKAKDSQLPDTTKAILESATNLITKAPLEAKHDTKSIYIFDTGEQKVYFDKKLFSFIDGGLLYSNNGKNGMPLIKSVNEDGSVKGYLLGLRIPDVSKITEEKPSKLRSFSKKMQDLINAQVSSTENIEEVTDNGEEETGSVLSHRSDGERASRLLGEMETGTVQGTGTERNSVDNSGERGVQTGRSDNRPDAERSQRGHGEGSSQSADLRRDNGLTPEETAKAAEKLHEEVTQQIEQKSTEKPKGRNFVIGESLDLPNGEKARYKANIEAIRLVKQLETEGRYATEAEQAILSKYVGWGGLANAFDERKADWSKEYNELKELLTEEEYNLARGSTLNAHYTDISVIKAMYDGLAKLGFDGGRMLEPSSGVGNFVGAMPVEMSSKVKSWTMVELDGITGLIAKYLYPNADVRIQGFEKANIPNNYMDVAISNVPFGNYPITDKAYPKKVTSAIHNYFFAKTLDKVRPGGIVMFITSSYTMNSKDSTVRRYIMQHADLLGAIRLPDTAFKGNAGTEVVTDILILKKRAANTSYAGVDFLEAPYQYVEGYRGANINNYFIEHPEMVLGTASMTGSMYRSDSLTYKAFTDRGSLADQIREAFTHIEGKMDYPATLTPEKTNFAVERAGKKAKNNGLVVRDGKVYQNKNGDLIEVSVAKGVAERISGMLEIRDAAKELQNYQQQGLNDTEIKKARLKLNKLYDAFVKKHGYINAPANRNALKDDPDKFSLLALENWNSETKKATKSDIFSKNTVAPNRTVTSANDVSEGLIVSVNQTGTVDVSLIAKLTGKSESDVTRELIDSRQVFKNRDGELETAEVYLSGNVRAKLRDAEALVPIDSDYAKNVEALKAVMPEDVGYQDIFVNPGTPWIPASVYSDFAAYMLGTRNTEWRTAVDITYNKDTGNFTVELKEAYLKYNASNTQKWGTSRRSFLDLFSAMLNSKSVVIKNKLDDGSTVIDKDATAAANEKIENITKEFQEWLWQDEARRTELATLYNETFNSVVTPTYNGDNLTVNGANAMKPLRPHQRNAVQRIISSGGNTLLAHKVGAGKTYEMAAAAMKLKQLGLVKKPMFAVPKPLVAQWGTEFMDFFPTARLLVAEASDFTAANRKVFANRIANGDYDAVIVSYEQFEKLPISDDFARELYQEQIDSVIRAIEEAKAEKGSKSLSVKDLEKKRKSLQAKIDKLTDKAKDEDNIEFEQLGVDSLFIDEAHNFKNLFYTSSMTNVSGLGNKDGSKRAFDLFTKVRYLQKLNGGRGIVFATATPVMNSMSEMYIMQRYLQPDLLEQLGISSFDAWAKQFGEVVNGVEIKPSGQGYRVKQSFSRFKNMSELQLLFRNFADVLTDIPGLKIPKMKGGQVQVVVCEPGQFQQDFMKELEKRADNVKNVDPSVDNMLKITSDGRKISYTQRMIDPTLPYEEGCKIYRCADNVIELYNDSKSVKGTQLIFCDMATPKGKSNTAATETEEVETDMESARLYDDIKARLVKGGIPAKEIAFIHEADTDVKKKKLFADVNEGKVRVLIGSTGKMGVGMNAQKRIVAIHHLDAPWRPGDVEQRNGRAFRQGNINDEVMNFTYVTEGSFDARLWDILDRKQGFINQIMNGENVGREAEDTGEVTLSAAEVKALASGSPLIMEQVQLDTDIKKLESLHRAHISSVRNAKDRLTQDKGAIATFEKRIAAGKADLATRVDTYSEGKFSITVGKSTYTDKKDAGAALVAEATAKANTEGYTTIGKFAGFELRVVKTHEGIKGLISGKQGYSFNTYPNNPTYGINHLIAQVEGISESVQAWELGLEETKKDMAEQEKLIAQPFAKQAELDQKRARYNEVMEILNPKEEQALDTMDEDTEQHQARNYLDDEQPKKYNKRSKYSETETKFLSWSHGSAPIGEIKRFNRFGVIRYYEKTENGCVELSRAQYEMRGSFNAKNTYTRAQRQISGAVNRNGSAGGNLSGSSNSNRNSGRTSAVYRQTLGKGIRNDAARSISSSSRNNSRIAIGKREAISKAFSLSNTIEGAPDLIAFHNTSLDKLTDILNRNGLLMPSLAITNKGMTDFGEISLLFDKSTIDPSANSENKLYGADAWTPTQTELKKNAKFDTAKTNAAVSAIKNNIGSYAAELFNVTPEQFKRAIVKADGSIYDAYAHNIGMQTAYAMKQGIISEVPTNNDGTVNTDLLHVQLKDNLNTDNGWRLYKRWLNKISDTIITSYDQATNEDILRNMKSQPATAKTFELSETGELVVPAVEYYSVDEVRKNKTRLSENAAEATKSVADAFLKLANQISKNTKSVVNAINKAFANRYSVADIVRTFGKQGITISTDTASRLQALYKEAVELPTQYFEAKPGREIGFDEIRYAVMPAGPLYTEVKGKLEDLGISVIEYNADSNESRIEALNSVEDVKFQQRTETLTDREVLVYAAQEVEFDNLDDGERDALSIFNKRLAKLEELQNKRAEQGRLYKEQQFGAKVDRAEAAKTLERMKVLDSQIEKASAEVLSIEDKAVLKRVLQKARTVVEQQERVRSDEKLKRWRDRRNNADAIKKYRTRLKNDVDDLTNWILHPNNKDVVKHIPDVLKESVIPFLSSINFMSKQSLRGGNPTVADKEFIRRLEGIQAAIKTNIDAEGLYSGYNDLPPDFMDSLQTFISTTRAIVDSNSGEFVINQMTSDELRELSKVVRTLKKYITQVNKFHANAMFEHVYEAGDDSIASLKDMSNASSRTGNVSNFVFWQQIRPAYAFERFGEGGIAIYDGFRRGQATLAFNTKKIQEFAEKAYTAKEVEAWEKEIKEIELATGTVRLPVSTIMSFYELSKREQALGHILGMGVRVATYKNGKEKISDVGHRLSEYDVKTIISALTPRQMEVADNLQKFMAEQGGKWGNYVSVKRFGEELFGEEHYFPIHSDGRHLQSTADEHPSAASLYALLNMSFTKELTQEANNRIILYSIFDVFANHMASMAQYNALALPMLDALKWFNYQQKSDPDENGKRMLVASVREEMSRVYGVPEESRPGSGRQGYAETFVMNILKAFNGTEAQGVPTDATGLTTLRRYNMAQVAYNFRVVVQQPLAITRAALLMDYTSIIKGMRLSPKAIQKNITEMREHSGIAAWKALGFYDVNISRGLTDVIKHKSSVMDKIGDIGMKGAEFADTMAWAVMWSAAKEEVIRKQKLTPKDDGFYEAVTKLFEDVIYKTQVVDSVLTKNEYLRSKGFFARAIGSFMSEPTTTASMLIDAYDKYHADMQRGMNRAQAWKKNRRMIGRVATVYAVSAILLSAVQAIADAARDDDDYQTFLEKWLEAFGGNIIDELVPINKLPILSDFYEVAKELIATWTGADIYGNAPQSVFMQWYDSLVKGSEILHDLISGEDTSYTWYGGIYKLLQAASGMSGLPMAAGTRELVTAWNNIIGAMAPSLKVKTYDPGEKSSIRYAYQDGFLTADEAIEQLISQELVDTEDEAYWLVQGWEAGDGYSRYTEIYDAVRNGEDFNAAMDELTSHGYTEKDVLSNVKGQIGTWYKDGEITKQQATTMLSRYIGLDSDEITKLVNNWQSVIDTGIEYSKIKEEYLAGNITYAQAVSMRVRYGGYTQEKATEDVNKWKAEKDTGLPYDDKTEAFKTGEISAPELINILVDYGGYTEEKAAETVVSYTREAYEEGYFDRNKAANMMMQYGGLTNVEAETKLRYIDFKKEYPDIPVDSSWIDEYYTEVESSGIAIDVFVGYRNQVKSITGDDKKVRRMAVIDSLPITDAQKDALYYAEGWAASKLYEAPWH